jgi:hypothetical protein
MVCGRRTQAPNSNRARLSDWAARRPVVRVPPPEESSANILELRFNGESYGWEAQFFERGELWFRMVTSTPVAQIHIKPRNALADVINARRRLLKIPNDPAPVEHL